MTFRALFEKCIQHMSNRLERNICKVLTPGTKIDTVERSEVEKFISEDLQYACRYWIQHLRRIRAQLFRDKQIQEQVYEFLKNKFLYWLEALSLMCSLSDGLAALTILDDLVVVTVLDQNIVR